MLRLSKVWLTALQFLGAMSSPEKKIRKLFLLLEILGHMYIRSIKNVIIINISELEFFFSYLDHFMDLVFRHTDNKGFAVQ